MVALYMTQTIVHDLAILDHTSVGEQRAQALSQLYLCAVLLVQRETKVKGEVSRRGCLLSRLGHTRRDGDGHTCARQGSCHPLLGIKGSWHVSVRGHDDKRIVRLLQHDVREGALRVWLL
jgi:hypothetical protein